jgi:Presenilin
VIARVATSLSSLYIGTFFATLTRLDNLIRRTAQCLIRLCFRDHADDAQADVADEFYWKKAATEEMSDSLGSRCQDESEISQLLKVNSNDQDPVSPVSQVYEVSNPAPEIDLKEISYAIGAFFATLQPVAITLVLSTLAVVYIKSPFSLLNADGGLSVYDISDGSESSLNDSNTVKLGKSMINAIVIVGAIALMTSVVVFLYWARCMRFIQGYMIFSSFMLLCLMGGVFFFTIIDQFQIRFDWITFFFLLYNFSVVGVVAIFFQKGRSKVASQNHFIYRMRRTHLLLFTIQND